MSTKDKIIHSAIKNFLNFGFNNTSLSDIAKEVGIKKSSIYYHFKNKEELFTTSIIQILKSLQYQISNSIDTPKSSRHKLETLCSSIIEFNAQLSIIADNTYSNNSNLLNLFSSAISVSEELKFAINDYYSFLKNTILNIIKFGQKNKEIKKDINNESISLQIIAWIDGLFVLSTVYPSFNINSIRQDFYENIWTLLSAEKKPKKNFFGNKKSSPKTISLGTKW